MNQDSLIFEYEHFIAYTKRPESEYLRFHVTEDYKNEMAVLTNVPYREIHISGLKQNSLEYFVSNYAHHFPIIDIVACDRLQDFSCFETLATVEYIMIDRNISAIKLWDMSQNASLRGLYLNDVKKLKDLSDVITAPNLKELAVIESTNSALGSNKWRLATLSPLHKAPRLERLKIIISKIEDMDISPLLKSTNLKRLVIARDVFTLENFARIYATLKNASVYPDKPFEIFEGDNFAYATGTNRQLKLNSPKLIEIQKKWDEIVKENDG